MKPAPAKGDREAGWPPSHHGRHHTAPSTADEARPLPDFSDVEETFRHLSDGELRQTRWLFSLMGSQWLTERLSGLSAWAVRWRSPARPGASSARSIASSSAARASRTRSRASNVSTTAGSRASSTSIGGEVERGGLRAVQGRGPASDRFLCRDDGRELRRREDHGPRPDEVLEKYNSGATSTRRTPRTLAWRSSSAGSTRSPRGPRRRACSSTSTPRRAGSRTPSTGSPTVLMERYNRGKVVVLNTFQLYRHDRLAFLHASDERARSRATCSARSSCAVPTWSRSRSGPWRRASPPHPARHRVDPPRLRRRAALLRIERHERICTTIGSHNEASTRLGCQLIEELGIPRDTRTSGSRSSSG